MRKTLVSIANYGTGQIQLMERQIAELRKANLEMDIVVDSTVDWSMPGVEVRRFDPEIAKGLTFAHRKLFIENRGRYDIYIYLENDLLMTPAALDKWLELTAILPEDYITGFVRYENRGEDCCLIDLAHPWMDGHVEIGLHRVNDMLMFCPGNLHSGCYALTSDQLDRAIESRGYVTKPHKRPYGVLEQGASDVYTQCGFRLKVLPFDFEPLLVHHMPDKYIYEDPRWTNPGSHTVESFKQMLLDHAHPITLPIMTKPRFWIHDRKKQLKTLLRRVGLMN